MTSSRTYSATRHHAETATQIGDRPTIGLVFIQAATRPVTGGS
ncbi:MAG TPA: hypothetical protein VFB12_08860 [Ktedonobacteraceae bacterium]|nr:hypothetical protein [Ktedonobacteraceae bacterium]